MLILVPWKPVVVVWLLLTAMTLFWAGAMCVVEGKNPFRIEKYQMRTPLKHASGRPASHRRRTNRPAANAGGNKNGVRVAQTPLKPPVGS